MSDIFISYSHKDELFARQLAESLSEAGINVWIDVDDIPVGMKWSTAVQKGLALCMAMIVIITPESMTSRNVEDEWQYFLDQEKPVVPVLRKPSNIHFQLNRIQRIDFYSQPYEDALQYLFLELEHLGTQLKPGMITMRPTTTIGRRPPSFPTKAAPEPRRSSPLLIFALLGVLVAVGGGLFVVYNNGSRAAALVPTSTATSAPTHTPTPTETSTATAVVETATSTAAAEVVAATPELTATAQVAQVILTATDPVNVRIGDDPAFARQYTLIRGQQAVVLGVNLLRNWWYIEYTDQQSGEVERGWVSNLFVSLEGDSDALPTLTRETARELPASTTAPASSQD